MVIEEKKEAEYYPDVRHFKQLWVYPSTHDRIMLLKAQFKAKNVDSVINRMIKVIEKLKEKMELKTEGDIKGIETLDAQQLIDSIDDFNYKEVKSSNGI